MEEIKKMMHVGTSKGQISKYVFLPSSPERAEKIASYLDNSEEIAYNREYHSFKGYLDGVEVTVCSTGMGGPSLTIAIEELAECGAETMIRVGTCNSTSEKLDRNEVLIPNGAVRMETVSNHFSPVEYPAVPDSDVLDALAEAAEKVGVENKVGIVITRANFHTMFQKDKRPWGSEIRARWNAYEAGGALGSDVTTSPLLVAASNLGLRAGSVLGCSSAYGCYSDDYDEWDPLCEENAIKVAIEAMRIIIAEDNR